MGQFRALVVVVAAMQEVNIWWLPDSIERVFYCKY